MACGNPIILLLSSSSPPSSLHRWQKWSPGTLTVQIHPAVALQSRNLTYVLIFELCIVSTLELKMFLTHLKRPLNRPYKKHRKAGTGFLLLTVHRQRAWLQETTQPALTAILWAECQSFLTHMNLSVLCGSVPGKCLRHRQELRTQRKPLGLHFSSLLGASLGTLELSWPPCCSQMTSLKCLLSGPRGLRRDKIIFYENTRSRAGDIAWCRGLCQAFTRLWFQPSVLKKEKKKKNTNKATKPK